MPYILLDLSLIKKGTVGNRQYNNFNFSNRFTSQEAGFLCESNVKYRSICLLKYLEEHNADSSITRSVISALKKMHKYYYDSQIMMFNYNYFSEEKDDRFDIFARLENLFPTLKEDIKKFSAHKRFLMASSGKLTARKNKMSEEQTRYFFLYLQQDLEYFFS